MKEYPTSEPPGYLSVKQAAKILHVSERRVHQYIEAGRLPAYQPGREIMLPVKEVEQFRPKLTGRPRQKTPGWRGSADATSLAITYIQVQARSGQEANLLEKLQAIKREGRHLFPGTIMRYISLSDGTPPTVTIQLVWRSSETPDEATRRKALDAFEAELSDVLDWKTAAYRTEKVAIHS